MPIHHVSLGFAQFTDGDLAIFTEGVIAQMTGNGNYPQPVVPLATLQASLDAYNNTLAATAQGGTEATAAKDAARQSLEALLRQEANYVQGAANNDLPKLLSSGFATASTNRTRAPLLPPAIVDIDNEASTQLLLRLTRVTNAKAYEVRVSTAPGAWQPAGVFTQARRIVLDGLTPGTVYTAQARAVGGTTGYRDWSNPVSHMAI